MKIKLVCACLFLGFLLPLFSHAESADNYLQLGVGTQNFGYKEYDDQGVLLDREDGLVPGFSIVIGKNRRSVSGAIRLELFDGRVDYDGQTQSGIPLTTKTDERIITVEALLRFDVEALAENDGVFIFGIGHREWRRDIRATNITSSLFEVYRWKYLTLGGAATLLRREKWSGELDFRWLWPIDPTMSLNLAGYDAMTLNLKARSSTRVGFNFRFGTYKGQELTISPYWELWNMGRSNDAHLTVGGVPTAFAVHEPRSETNIVGVTVTVRL